MVELHPLLPRTNLILLPYAKPLLRALSAGKEKRTSTVLVFAPVIYFEMCVGLFTKHV